jgi:uncharacterized protein (TIGR02117 family)
MNRLLLRQILKFAAAGIGLILAIPLLYFLAALILGAVPVNGSWQEPKEGVTIFIRTNGVHTWIMVPSVTPQMDWRPLAPAEHLKDRRWEGNYLAIGYGNREFYLNTPTWGDLTVGRAVGAAVGSGTTLMHVDHSWNPKPSEWQRPLRLRPDEYKRLSDYIRASFRYDAQGRTIPLPGRGYGASDVFYEGLGSYSALVTCNSWTGRALRHAGVRMGAWTPLSQSIMWRLD